MRLPSFLRRRLVAWAAGVRASRPPDVKIGGADNPYMLRWHAIPRNRFFNIYLHQFLRSDDDRALHDHPWVSCSVLLEGAYIEITPAGEFLRVQGDFAIRRATASHRIELRHGSCMTMFITGPRVRQWGFHCPKGWRHWKDFVHPTDKGAVGPGCD
jgi:hypothetical protein